jgi:hypothetical protein
MNQPIGKKMDTGEIVICPYCGRVGLIKAIEDLKWVTHSDGLTPNQDGTHSVPEDECPKPGIPLLPFGRE